MMKTESASTPKREAEAFIAENEPLLERATPATLHRIILHGGEIASRLSDEVVGEMKDEADALNFVADAINDSATPPARIQRLEEERMRVQASSLESTKQQTFEALSDIIQRAITLRQEREDSEYAGPVLVHDGPIGGADEQPIFTTRVKRRGFWQRLFG